MITKREAIYVLEHLDGQLFATVKTTALKNLTAGGGGVSGTESVFAGAFELFWLVSSFGGHGGILALERFCVQK